MGTDKKWKQDRLAESFIDADDIFFKEVFQKERIPENERLDVLKIKEKLTRQGKKVTVFDDMQVVKDFLQSLDFEQEYVVVILSNGSFDGIPVFVKELKV